jgi:hypothetical protein
MKTFKNLKVEVVTDPRDPKCVRAADQYVSIRGDLGEDSPGLHYVWFCLTREELATIARDGYASMRDGYHRLDVMGDRSTFYNMDEIIGANKSSGKASIPYLAAYWPAQAWRVIQRLAMRVWDGQKRAFLDGADRYSVPRVDLEITAAMRGRWTRIYGQGTGKVELEVAPGYLETDDTRELFEARLKLDGPRPLRESVERLRQIAANLTYASHHVATVVLHKDLDGYYFSFRNPHGRTDGLRGGVVNHGARNGEQEWSIHT